VESEKDGCFGEDEDAVLEVSVFSLKLPCSSSMFNFEIRGNPFHPLYVSSHLLLAPTLCQRRFLILPNLKRFTSVS
jgi:hypothetical protein